MTVAERDEMLMDISLNVKGLNVAIMGNGTKGLAQRVDELEADTKPTTAKILRKRGLDVAIIGVIFAGARVLGSWQGWW